MSVLHDRVATLLLGLAWTATGAACWLAGRLGLFGPSDLAGYRWLLLGLLAAGSAACALWARSRLTARLSGAPATRLWAISRWPDGRVISAYEDPIATLAISAAAVLSLVLACMAGRAGLPTDAGASLPRDTIQALVWVSLAATVAGAIRLRAVSRPHAADPTDDSHRGRPA